MATSSPPARLTVTPHSAHIHFFAFFWLTLLIERMPARGVAGIRLT